MEFKSMENSSPTAQPTSKNTAGGHSNHGPAATISSPKGGSGSSQTLATGVSTAVTSDLSHARSFDIVFGPYGRFLRKCPTHSASLLVLAALTAAIAWSGHLATIPLSLMPVTLLCKAQSRAQAYAIFASYYFGASWPLIPGARAFFGDKASILDGLLLCLIATLLLAIPAAVLFTRNPARLLF